MSATIAIPFIALLAVLLMMLVELQLSRFNERTLRARGATEPAGDVYPTMTWVYPACFVVMGIEGALAGRAPGLNTLVGVALFGVAKALKFWAIATLGPRWTFRVLVLPGAPLVRGGPYAWARHPNYVAVIGEFVSFAILVGAPLAGILSVLVFGALLRRRIRVEERALGISGPERV